MSPDKQWLWQTRGLLGGIDLLQRLSQEGATPPPKARAELEQARAELDALLAQQRLTTDH